MTTWITSKEISAIAECGMDKARQILCQANKTVKGRGYIVPNQRKAPRAIVLEILGLLPKIDEKTLEDPEHAST